MIANVMKAIPAITPPIISPNRFLGSSEGSVELENDCILFPVFEETSPVVTEHEGTENK